MNRRKAALMNAILLSCRSLGVGAIGKYTYSLRFESFYTMDKKYSSVLGRSLLGILMPAMGDCV